MKTSASSAFVVFLFYKQDTKHKSKIYELVKEKFFSSIILEVNTVQLPKNALCEIEVLCFSDLITSPDADTSFEECMEDEHYIKTMGEVE